MVITNSVDYVRWTQTTALYLDKCADETIAASYEILGVLDEVGEVAGMLKRVIRDGVASDRTKFELELGDIAWYLARIHYNHADTELDSENGAYPLIVELGLLDKVKGLTCFDIALLICDKLRRHYSSKAAAAKFQFGPKPPDLISMIQAAHRGFTRDDACSQFVIAMYRKIFDTNPAGILMHLASEAHSMEAIFDWVSLCERYEFNVLDVLQNNVIKLESRKERGVLHGKGSDR